MNSESESGQVDVPVHDSLCVTETTELYRNDEWWKAVVTYQFEGSDANETAMYLWHKGDDDWTRKNKYVIKTAEAWATDREIIDRYIRGDRPDEGITEFPVSDYYTVGAGETVFESDGWWKAIVTVVEKGTYETHEVMVYVWQQQDGDWRRRQKYTIKRVSDWEDERAAIENHLSIDSSDVEEQSAANSTDPGMTSGSGDEVTVDDGVSDEFSALDDELDAHLSGEFTNAGQP